MSSSLTYDQDLAPFVRLAFPRPLTEQSVLTAAQQTFLGALLANWHRGMPFDKDLCRALLST